MKAVVESFNLGLLKLGLAVSALVAVLMAPDLSEVTPWIVTAFFGCLLTYRLDCTNIWVAFAIPWLLILLFSGLTISDYSRPVERETITVIVAVLGIGLVVLPARTLHVAVSQTPLFVNDGMFKLLLAGYLVFCALNVVLAGYVPLFRAIMGDDSGYLEFGVKGIYGLFNAFANAFGLTAFYLWTEHRQRKLYMFSFLLVLLIFLVFVTRQNMMSLLVEAFIVYNLKVRRLSGAHILGVALIALFGFAAIGDFRAGVDISELASIRTEYLWIPRAFIWLYTYCYFNILNLDNVVVTSPVPIWDGSSLAQLLPSFLRPEVVDSEGLLEVSMFTVTSFISPLYRDFGAIGTCVIFVGLCLAAHWYVGRLYRHGGFIGATGYAVLYFCFLFSFFVNFWFYLPVIFQLVFLPMFQKIILRTPQSAKGNR